MKMKKTRRRRRNQKKSVSVLSVSPKNIFKESV